MTTRTRTSFGALVDPFESKNFCVKKSVKSIPAAILVSESTEDIFVDFECGDCKHRDIVFLVCHTQMNQAIQYKCKLPFVVHYIGVGVQSTFGAQDIFDRKYMYEN